MKAEWQRQKLFESLENYRVVIMDIMSAVIMPPSSLFLGDTAASHIPVLLVLMQLRIVPTTHAEAEGGGEPRGHHGQRADGGGCYDCRRFNEVSKEAGGGGGGARIERQVRLIHAVSSKTNRLRKAINQKTGLFF